MQQRFHNYKETIRSFDANQRDFTIAPSGVYAGFDAIQDGTLSPIDAGYVAIDFLHTDTAMRFINSSGGESFLSCVKSEQGIVITESAKVTLPISTANTADRIDALVLRHAYIESTGGAVATYEVIEGVEGSLLEPNIPLDAERTVLGWLLVRASATNAGGMVWLRKNTPAFGNADFRQSPIALNTLLSLHEHDTELTFISNSLILPFTGNIYTVKSRTPDAQHILYQLPHRKRKVFGTNESGAVIFLRVSLDSDVPLILYDENNMTDMGATVPDAGYKWIKTGTGSDVSIALTGWVQMIERESFWEVVSFQDYLTHPFILADKLTKKNLWGIEPLFQSAVATAAASTLMRQSVFSPNVAVSSGLMVNGVSSVQRNVYFLNVTTGTPVLGLQNAFALGAEVTIFFAGTETYVANSAVGVDTPLQFISDDSFDYVAKPGGYIKGVQLLTGFYITEGEKREVWITPALPSGVNVLLANGPFKYKIGVSGKIEFNGTIEIESGGAGYAAILKLPKSVFKSPDWAGYKIMRTHPFGIDIEGDFNLTYFINSSDEVEFRIASESAYAKWVNFNGCYIYYK